jgi:hypothetical protein
MAAPAVVMLEVVGDQPAQVALVEDDHLVETVAAEGADDPFGERILR